MYDAPNFLIPILVSNQYENSNQFKVNPKP